VIPSVELPRAPSRAAGTASDSPPASRVSKSLLVRPSRCSLRPHLPHAEFLRQIPAANMGKEMNANADLASGPIIARCGEPQVDPALRKSYESDESAECASDGNRESSPDSLDNPLRLRESAIKRGCGTKGQKMCCYQHCPSPLHSKKWRVVTPGTSAGGRDWEPLVDQTLCDSCYSTYRKHGTFVRSVRTNEGWFRVDASGAQPADAALQTKKALPLSSKRSRVENARSEIAAKRQDRKFAALLVELGEDRGSQVQLVLHRTLFSCSCHVCTAGGSLQFALTDAASFVCRATMVHGNHGRAGPVGQARK
jgi:hypothetical protein